MGKMCSLSRHTTSLLSGIATLECKMVKMEIKELGHCSLVSSFQSSFFAICARSVDQTTLELLAFLQRVTCLTTLVFKVWSTSVWNFGENSIERRLNETGRCNQRSRARRRSRAATSAAPYPAHARTPRRRKTPRSEARADATVH
jgi:hypothetical protein